MNRIIGIHEKELPDELDITLIDVEAAYPAT
jgi:hypothetical protein